MEIVWRLRALDDLEAARRHIAENNPAAAARVHAAILTSVARLANHPNLGRPGRVPGTRERVVPRTPYIIAYAVIDDELMILSIMHSARRWPDRF
ncbi:MAG TPA: type II toxin-antitoxin system RelE/ParE family toxin [Stellaceae bacterium]|nr:type II toxin-antitoxin system RelE/ParE family toxin [Stellaceae bacterium]